MFLRRLGRLFLAWTMLLLASLLASDARAQDVADLPPGTGTGDSLTEGLENQRPFWSGSGPTRPFFASTIEGGALFVRPTAHLGYGKPFHRWIGAEGGASLALGGVRLYGGLHVDVPKWGEFHLHARYENPRNQFWLPVRRNYTRQDLEIQSTGRSAYIVGEAEYRGSYAVPGGNIAAVLTGYYIGNIPDDRYVFERGLRVVLDPPWMWRARLAYLYHLGWLGTMRLGAAGEVIHLVNRGEAVVRAGPALSVSLTHHLDAVGAAMIVVASPDNLGLVGADLGQLVLRYRWSTGDRWADFP